MFFGKQWLSFQDTVKTRAMNLIQLLSNAVSLTMHLYTKAIQKELLFWSQKKIFLKYFTA